MGRKFQWDAILPNAPDGTRPPDRYLPRDSLEKTWLAEWSAPLAAADLAANGGRGRRAAARVTIPCRRPRPSPAVHRRARRPPLVSLLSADVRRRVVHQMPYAFAAGSGAANRSETERSDGRDPRDDRLRPDRRGNCQEPGVSVDGRDRRRFRVDVFIVGRCALRDRETRHAFARRGERRPRGRRRETGRHSHGRRIRGARRRVQPHVAATAQPAERAKAQQRRAG